MTLSFGGTGPVVSYAPSTKIKPFQNVRVLDSSSDGAASINLTITVSDIAGGGPTDADGTFPSGYLKQVAPGTYTLNGYSSTGVTNILEGLTFPSGTTPGTAVFTLAATDKINQAASDSNTQLVTAIAPARFLLSDTTAHNTYAVQGTLPAPSAGISAQYIVQTDNPTLSADNLNVTALSSGAFIHTGSGTDAIDVSGVTGKNILDGGTNSNFLTGTLAGKGTDTFFVDARNAPSDIWDTVVNFHAGDAVTLFGLTPTNKVINWVDNQGTGTATGLTLHATQAGAPTDSFTLAGYTTADLSNGRLGVIYGAEADGTPYLYVTGLK